MFIYRYTTDNGAFYYYNTEKGSCHGNGKPCEGYEATMHALKAYTERERVPLRWILYDSWFYSKVRPSVPNAWLKCAFQPCIRR